MDHAIVIGAGISGLSAAHDLHRAGRPVQVLEASDRTGGLIRSEQDDGFLFEHGPTTFPASAGELLALCRELNLSPQQTHGNTKQRYLYVNGQLYALPGWPTDWLKTPILSTAGKWAMVQEPFRPKMQEHEPTVGDFFRYRLGSDVAERIVDPFISGIYAGNMDALSLPAVFPQLWQWDQENGGILKGMLRSVKVQQKTTGGSRMRLLSFDGGLETLTNALVSALPENTVRLHTPVRRIEAIRDKIEAYRLYLPNGETLDARHLIIATPADVTARLLGGLSADAARTLHEIPYSGLAVVHAGFKKEEIPHPLDGFGCLLPRRERLPLLGSIWASSLFPERAPAGHVLLSNFIGGAHQPEIVERNAARIEAIVLENLAEVFKTRQPLQPRFCRTLHYDRAIPQYTLGHQERIQKILDALPPGIQLCGNYLHGVALNECVKSGLAAARYFLQ